MVSRRKTIIDAVVARLNTITIANGYATDLGNAGGAATPRSPFDGVVLPKAVVSAPEESKSEPTITYYANDLLVEISAMVAEDGATGLEEQIDELVSDIERALLTANAQDPPLLVSGVVDIVLLGHDKWRIQERALVGAYINARINYRHNITDPSVFP